MVDTEQVKEDVKVMKAVWNVVRFIEGLALITIGVLAIVYKDNDNFQAWIYRILGIVLTIDGIISVFRYYFLPSDFSEAISNFAGSIVEITFGVFFIMKADETLDAVRGLLLYFISILCFVNAFVLITGSTFGIIKKLRNMALAVFEYILAAAFITGGVLLLVNQDKAQGTLYVVILVIIGLVMIAIGIYDIVTIFIPYSFKRAKKAKVEKEHHSFFHHKKEDKTVDVESVEHNDVPVENNDDNHNDSNVVDVKSLPNKNEEDK